LVTENRALRKIPDSMEEELTGGRRKVYNEELHNL
jgi:hypothetical protein